MSWSWKNRRDGKGERNHVCKAQGRERRRCSEWEQVAGRGRSACHSDRGGRGLRLHISLTVQGRTGNLPAPFGLSLNGRGTTGKKKQQRNGTAKFVSVISLTIRSPIFFFSDLLF